MRFSLSCCSVILASSIGFNASAASVKPLDIYPDDMLILKFTMGSRILLAENIIAYPNMFSGADETVHTSIALSFTEFVNAVEFAISVDAEKGLAEGWFISERRRFQFDLRAGKAVVAGQQYELNPQQFQWYGDELYIDIELLAQWFNLSFDYLSNQQSLNLSAKEVLPFQRKWAREAQRKKLNGWLERNRLAAAHKSNLPLYRSDYDWVSTPNVQLNGYLGYNYHKVGEKGHFYRYNGTVYHDLLYQSTKWYFKGNEQNGLDDVRLTMGREDETKSISGLGLSSYQLGDSYSFDVPLIAYGVLGRGISVSNFDLGYRSQSNAVTINGDSQPGWDIELYRNKALIDAAKVASDGTYEFVDVPLLSGINDIKLVFYGPRGEKQERHERYYMHPDLMPEGQFNWRASLHSDHQRLIDLGIEQPTSQETRHKRMVVQSEFGLTDSMSLSAAYVALPLPKETTLSRYVALGNRFTTGNTYVRQQYIRYLNNQSSAFELFASSQFGRLNINASLGQFSQGFVSEYRRREQTPLKRQALFNLHHSFSSQYFSHLSIGIKAKHEDFHQGKSARQLTFKQSLAKGALSVTNELNYKNHLWDGFINFNLPEVFDVRFRGKVEYGISGGSSIDSVSLTAETQLFDDYRCSAEFDRLLDNQQTSRLGLRLVRSFDGFDLDLSARYQSGGHYDVALTAAFALDDFSFRDKNQVQTAKVNARVFLDGNNNHVFDEGDTPLPQVHFSIDGSASEAVTDSSGMVTLPVNAERLTVVKVSPGVHEDYYWDVEVPERAVISRQGKPLQLDFAAALNGEIEGFVMHSGQTKPVSGVVLELVSSKGEVIQTVKSGFDGFYLFEKVRFGNYSVRVSAAQLNELHYLTVEPITVELSQENDIVSGIEFYLER